MVFRLVLLLSAIFQDFLFLIFLQVLAFLLVLMLGRCQSLVAVLALENRCQLKWRGDNFTFINRHINPANRFIRHHYTSKFIQVEIGHLFRIQMWIDIRSSLNSPSKDWKSRKDTVKFSTSFSGSFSVYNICCLSRQPKSDINLAGDVKRMYSSKPPHWSIWSRQLSVVTVWMTSPRRSDVNLWLYLRSGHQVTLYSGVPCGYSRIRERKVWPRMTPSPPHSSSNESRA